MSLILHVSGNLGLISYDFIGNGSMELSCYQEDMNGIQFVGLSVFDFSTVMLVFLSDIHFCETLAK